MDKLDCTVGVIGAGSMGGAIASGLVGSGVLAPSQVLVCDHHPERLAELAAACGVTTFETASELVAAGPDVLVCAVAPVAVPQLLTQLAPSLGGLLVISIAAGLPVESYRSLAPAARFVRVMPNMPVSVRSGASAIVAGSDATADDVALASSLFGALGEVAVMTEAQLDVESVVIGCAPAFFALLVDALTQAGVKGGLPAPAARRLLESTMAGTAQSLLQDGSHPRSYMESVATPGGTTAAALSKLDPAFTKGCYDAIDAALARTASLAAARND